LEITTWFGTIVTDKDGKISTKECRLCSKNPDIIARHIIDSRPSKASSLQIDLRSTALECGFVDSEKEYETLLQEAAIKASKIQISNATTIDIRIIQAVEALDDIDETTNLLSERLYEWYGMYFPELNLTSEDLAQFVAKHGSKSNITQDNKWYSIANDSMGAELSGSEEKIIKDFATNLCSFYKNRKEIEDYIVENMEYAAPNLTNIAGALLGSRLISMTGSLERLASLPSSTIQVIGANKALFKHLRSRATSPKHGVIFNHPLIKNAPWWQRGKIARAFAAKISLAARIDYYSGEFNHKLSINLDEKINNIKNTYPYPPGKNKSKK
jgi:nucleolar protein 56